MLVEGYLGDTGTASYSFNAAPVTDTTQPLTLGSTVNSSLAAPGEQDRYTVTLASASLLYFDALTNDGNFAWSLSGPVAPVSDRSFTDSDGFSISVDPVLALPAGSYTLTVSGSGQTTGAYSFRLLDLSQAAPLTTNTTVNGKLSPANSTNLHRFSASAGVSYYFESYYIPYTLDGSVIRPQWRLIDPYGNVLFNTSLASDADPLTLAVSGTYTLLVEGGIADSGTGAYVLKVDQQSVDVVPSDPSVPFKNQTGAVGDLANPTFHVQFKGDGQTHVFDLQFVGPATGGVLGSIPVTINAEYLYEVKALDPDGDSLTYKLVQAPSGMQIDPSSGLITWDPTAAQVGQNSVTVHVEDGHGGFATQAFVVNVMTVAPGSIQGTVFNDLNGDGIRNSIGGNSTAGIPPFQPAGSPFPAIGYDSGPAIIVTIGPGGTTTTTTTGQGPYEGSEDTYVAVVNQANSGVAVETLQLGGGSTPIFGFDGDGISTGGKSGYEGPGTYFTDIDTYTFASGKVNFNDGAGNGLQPGQQAYFALEDVPTTVIGTVLKPVPPVSVEPALAGWTVYLDLNHNGTFDPSEPSTQTDALGHYSFSTLVPGTYTVAEAGQPGWQQTAPPTGTFTATVQSGQVTNGLDFGNQQVTSADRMPAITSTPPTTATAGQLYRYNVAVSNSDGLALQFDLPVKPDGMAVDPQTGVIVWSPTTSQVGPQAVILHLQDARGDDVRQQFLINVNPSDTAPVIASTPPQSAISGLPYRYQVQAQDAQGDPLTYALTQGPAGMTIDPGTGLISWIGAPIGPGLPSGFQVTVTVSDGKGGLGSQSFTLFLVANSSNQAPKINSTPGGSVGLGHHYTYAVQAADPDGDPLTFRLPTAPAGMTIDAGGVIRWTPTAAQFGPNAVTVRVEDGRGGFDQQSFTVNVVSQPTNSPPSILSTLPAVATVGQPYSTTLSGSDPDGDLLIWSLDSAPAAISVNPTLGTVRWTPTLDQIGLQNIVVRLSDGQGGEATQTFTVNVHGVNVPPGITSEPPTTATVGVAYSYAVLATDIDNDPLTYSLTTAPAGMTIDPATGLIRWTPTAGQASPNSVAVLVSDGQGGTATQTFTVVVTNQAPIRPPVITSSPPFTATVGALYQYAVTATDPQGSALTYALTAAPPGMTIDPASGLIAWTPQAGQAGSPTVTVTAANVGGAAATQTFSVRVTVNHPPVINSSAPLSVTAGLAYRYDVQATDPDGDPMTYTLVAGPAGMSIDAFGRLTWPTSTANIGTQHVSIAVADNHGASTSPSFDVNVVADTQAPLVALSVTPSPANLGSQATFLVTAVDNVKVQSLTLTVGGVPVALDSSGRATMTMTTAGDLAVVATATDPAGNTGTATSTLTVIDPSVTNPPTSRSTRRPTAMSSPPHRRDRQRERQQPPLLHPVGRPGRQRCVHGDRSRHQPGQPRHAGNVRSVAAEQRQLCSAALRQEHRRLRHHAGSGGQRGRQPQAGRLPPLVHRPDSPGRRYPDHGDPYL